VRAGAVRTWSLSRELTMPDRIASTYIIASRTRGGKPSGVEIEARAAVEGAAVSRTLLACLSSADSSESGGGGGGGENMGREGGGGGSSDFSSFWIWDLNCFARS
jgi:hypothetical protein